MMNLRFRHGHDQDAHVISAVADLPAVAPGITEKPAEFPGMLDDAVNNYVNYQLERVHSALLGDVFNVIISHLAVSDAPEVYQKMRHALLGDHRSHVERHLLTFLHELYSDIDAEVENYKSGDITKNPRGPYYFFMFLRDGAEIHSAPMKLGLTLQERQAAREAFCQQFNCGNERVFSCWSTGDLKAHFQAYLEKIYSRSIFMKQLIDFCETCAWINQSIEQFSAGAQILNGEVPGVVLTYTGTTQIETTGFRLRGEYRANAAAAYESRVVRAEPDANKGLPFAYDALENLRVVAVNGNVDSSIAEKPVLRVTSQDGSALKFLRENVSGVKIPIAGIAPRPSEDPDQVERIYELPARHFRKELYIARR